MGTLVLAGATSGSATLTPVDAVTAVITLPSATATLATLGANTFVGNQAITGTLSTTSTAVIGSGANGQLQLNNAGGNNGASLWFSGSSVASGLKNWVINYGDFAGSTLVFAISNSAGGVINSAATEVGRFSSTGLAVTGTGSFNGALSNTTTFSTGGGNCTVSATGYLAALGSYNTTTANPANVQIDGAGSFNRVTSALKYKQDIRDLELIDVNKFRPVRYKSKCESDDQTVDHFGIIADEVDAAGIPELVTYGNDGEVEAFAYERLTVVLMKVVQDLTAKVSALEAK